MLPNQGETINIAAVVGEDLKLEMHHSVLSFSHKMKVLHNDLMIKRSTTEAEMAIWSFQLLKVMVLLQLTSQNAQIGAPQYLQ